MKRNAQYFFLTAVIAAAAGLLPEMFGPAFAQANSPDAVAGAPHDWSHRHLIYTNPDTRDEAARKGALAFEKWKEKSKDPRFAAQVARKARFAQAREQSVFSPEELQWANRHRRDPPPSAPAIHRDWSNILGGANSGVGKAGVFPAKFSFDINATADCTKDFVVYTTAAAGATEVVGVKANRTGTFTNFNQANGETVTIANGTTRTIVLTASTTANTGTNFQVHGSDFTITAANLAAAINRSGNTVGVTATSSGANVTVTAVTYGAAGNNISVGESLSSFGWGGGGNNLSGGTGTAGQPTIVAFNNLYKSTCTTGPVPTTYWSYNTGSGAFAETSPVLSFDGTQVAFVQRTGTVVSLVLLRWSSATSVGTIGTPTDLTTLPNANVTPANYRLCGAPCMTVITFSGSPNNTNSSPYYDYTNDILYVGDANGTLHKFTGIFSGAPAEAGIPWPISVSAGNMLASPVYDSSSGLVFVGSAATKTTGGQLHSVKAAAPNEGALVSSVRLAKVNVIEAGVHDAIIVDTAAQRVYAFAGSTDLIGSNATCNSSPCQTVFQFSVDLTQGGGAPINTIHVGRGQTSVNDRFLFAGTFDNAYYNSADATGNLYVCGSQSNSSQRPTMWKIPITGNVMGTPLVGASIVSGNSDCSPVTEIVSGGNEYLYVSATNGTVSVTGCTTTGGCIYMFNLASAWGSVPNAGLNAAGGTGGIIIDNISTAVGASQVYYSTLTGPGNAIQASQAALQ